MVVKLAVNTNEHKIGQVSLPICTFIDKDFHRNIWLFVTFTSSCLVILYTDGQMLDSDNGQMLDSDDGQMLDSDDRQMLGSDDGQMLDQDDGQYHCFNTYFLH